MLTFLVLLNLVLAGFDAWVSARRMRTYGISAEFNPAVRNIAIGWNPNVAAILGVLLPAATSIALCAFLKWVLLLALLAGYRLRMATIQYQSLVLTRKLGPLHRIPPGDALR